MLNSYFIHSGFELFRLQPGEPSQCELSRQGRRGQLHPRMNPPPFCVQKQNAIRSLKHNSHPDGELLESTSSINSFGKWLRNPDDMSGRSRYYVLCPRALNGSCIYTWFMPREGIIIGLGGIFIELTSLNEIGSLFGFLLATVLHIVFEGLAFNVFGIIKWMRFDLTIS